MSRRREEAIEITGSAKLGRDFVDVIHAWQHLEADLEGLRAFLEQRDKVEKIGVRALAATLSAHLLIEKLIQLQITASGDGVV
jgi:MoxR-like ATPase